MMDAINRTTKEREFKGNIFFKQMQKSRNYEFSFQHFCRHQTFLYHTPLRPPPASIKFKTCGGDQTSLNSKIMLTTCVGGVPPPPTRAVFSVGLDQHARTQQFNTIQQFNTKLDDGGAYTRGEGGGINTGRGLTNSTRQFDGKDDRDDGI